jgi:hypothetical protein
MTAMLSTTTMTRRLAGLLDTRDLTEWEAIRALGAGSARRGTNHDAYRAASGNARSAAQEAFRMIEYIVITTQITIVPTGESINSAQATRVELSDEGAGAFVTVEQDNGAVRIDPEEWPALRDAIERMMVTVRELERDGGQ